MLRHIEDYTARRMPDRNGTVRAVVSTALAVLVLLGGAFAGQALGLMAGLRIHRVLPIGPIRLVDRSVGAALGVLGVLLSFWLFVLPWLVDLPGWPAQQARSSAAARLLDKYAPDAPDRFQALRRLIGERNFPEVFDKLGPAPETGPPPMGRDHHARSTPQTDPMGPRTARRMTEDFSSDWYHLAGAAPTDPWYLSFKPATLPPSLDSFSLAGGQESTVSPLVVLTIAVSGGPPTEFRVSESATFDGAPWQAYSPSPPPRIELSAGLGSKTVHLQLRNAHGESAAARRMSKT